MSELLRSDEGDHEVDDGGDGQHGGDEGEDHHSFSTPFAMRATSAKIARVAAMKTTSSTMSS
jgi:hypothetical protein